MSFTREAINWQSHSSQETTLRLTILVLQDIYAICIQNEHCYSFKLTNIKTKL